MPGYKALRDYVDILRRLWAGEEVSYDGPAGTFPTWRSRTSTLRSRRHRLVRHARQPLGAKTSAASFDGVLLPPVFTPRRHARSWTPARRVPRDRPRPSDPDHLQSVITARASTTPRRGTLAHARAVTYLDAPVTARCWWN